MQSMDDNFTKEALDFVNVNFTNYPLNLNDFVKNHLNYGKIKKTPEL